MLGKWIPPIIANSLLLHSKCLPPDHHYITLKDSLREMMILSFWLILSHSSLLVRDTPWEVQLLDFPNIGQLICFLIITQPQVLLSSAMRHAVGANNTVSTTPSTARSTMVSQSISHIGQRLAAFHVSPRRPAATQGNYIYILILCLNIDLLFYLGSSSNRSLAQNARHRNESSSASQTSQDSQRRPVWQQSEFIKLCVCVAWIIAIYLGNNHNLSAARSSVQIASCLNESSSAQPGASQCTVNSPQLSQSLLNRCLMDKVLGYLMRLLLLSKLQIRVHHRHLVSVKGCLLSFPNVSL